jgi:hypothetical protein
MCPHQPPCPPADRPDRDAARTIAFHPEQGWSLLCNGVIVFDDTGELLPDGRAVPPHRPAVTRAVGVTQTCTFRVESSAEIRAQKCGVLIHGGCAKGSDRADVPG